MMTMMTMLTPYLAEETAYRREQLTRSWGHQEVSRTPRHGRGPGAGSRRTVVRTAAPAR